MFVHRT